MNDKDPLYEKALEICKEADQASVSVLQRKLFLGYHRAGKIIDQLEANGEIEAFNGIYPRKLIKKLNN